LAKGRGKSVGSFDSEGILGKSESTPSITNPTEESFLSETDSNDSPNKDWF